MIRVDLSPAELKIEPGGTAQLTITITNRQPHDDRVFLELEGIDVEWYALPVSAINVAAGESQSTRVLFKIARSSESQAGTYPFVVRAKGMESGETGIQQASLVIEPFSALQVELAPKRAVSTFFSRIAPFAVNVANLGNRPETLELYASDPEDSCAYEFETDRLTLKPGHSQALPLTVEPINTSVFGSGRLFGFSVTARSVDDSYVSGNAHGQLERRPLLSTPAAIVLLLLFLTGGALVLFRPRPVEVRSFTVTPLEVRKGQEVTLAWDASNLSEGLIQPGNTPIDKAIGSMKVKPEATTEYTLIARGGGKQIRRIQTVVVLPPIPVAKPRIVEFTASRKRIHAGDSVTLSWKVNNAQQVLLNPLGKDGDARLYKSQTVNPDTPTTYILTAKGPGGISEQSVKVDVVAPNESLAQIEYFRARPKDSYPGDEVKLSWEVTNAAMVEIDNGIGGGLSREGSRMVKPNETTTYTRRALDDRGNMRTAQVTVTVNPRPVEPPPIPEPESTPVQPIERP